MAALSILPGPIRHRSSSAGCALSPILSKMAQTNRILDPTIDTMFFTTSLRYAYLSSTIVKEVAHYDNTDISKFVNPCVAARLKEKLGS